MKKVFSHFTILLLCVSLILSGCQKNNTNNSQIERDKTSSNQINNDKTNSTVFSKSKQQTENKIGINIKTEPHNDFRGKLNVFPSYEGDYNSMENDTFDFRDMT